jgi:hypothetical protein
MPPSEAPSQRAMAAHRPNSEVRMNRRNQYATGRCRQLAQAVRRPTWSPIGKRRPRLRLEMPARKCGGVSTCGLSTPSRSGNCQRPHRLPHEATQLIAEIGGKNEARKKLTDSAQLNNAGKPGGIAARYHAIITKGLHTVSAKGATHRTMSPVLCASAVGALSDRFD